MLQLNRPFSMVTRHTTLVNIECSSEYYYVVVMCDIHKFFLKILDEKTYFYVHFGKNKNKLLTMANTLDCSYNYLPVH